MKCVSFLVGRESGVSSINGILPYALNALMFLHDIGVITPFMIPVNFIGSDIFVHAGLNSVGHFRFGATA